MSDDKEKNEKQARPLKEGLDYYLEAGKYVFTARYLKKRGYCCRSGCRHCPYGYKKKEDS